jgi:hypothetical protein
VLGRSLAMGLEQHAGVEPQAPLGAPAGGDDARQS